MSEFANIDSTPHEPSGREIVTKTVIWLVVGWLLAFLLFIILTLVGDTFTALLENDASIFVGNPLFPLLLLIIAFVVTFLWNIVVSALYNAFYSNEYYSFGSLLRMTLVSNIILFLFFAPIYLLFNGNIDALFFAIAFHIIFSVYVAHIQSDSLANPHYAASHVIGATMWVAFAMFIFAILSKTADNTTMSDKLYIFLLFPPILAFACVPLAKWIRQMIYYKFYESGNDFYFIPSPSEVLKSLNDVDNPADSEEEQVVVDDF